MASIDSPTIIGTPIASYRCEALIGVNKSKLLKKDINGYYEVVLGAFRCSNAHGAYYVESAVKDVFDKSGDLMRRIRDGNCRGEWGHPRFQEGMSKRAWFARVNDIYEPNLCFHISSVTLVSDQVKDDNGNYIIAVVGKIRPSGPNAKALQDMLDNPEENVCFSVRSFTEDSIANGRITKLVKHIVCWDLVTEPGIKYATKYNTPSLESYNLKKSDGAVSVIDTANFQRDVILGDDILLKRQGISMESCPGEFSTLKSLGWLNVDTAKSTMPVTRRW